MTRFSRKDLIEVTCDAPSMVQAAMEGNGTWSVRLNTGRVVAFTVQGDELVAYVTPTDAKAMAEMDVFAVDGYPRRPRTTNASVQSWIEEGDRLAQERIQGRAAPQGSGMADLLRELLGDSSILAERTAALMAAKAEEEAERRAQQRMSELAQQRVAMSSEFGFVRLAEHLSDEDVLQLFARFIPEVDPNELKSAARVTRISKECPKNLALQAAVRELLPEYHEEEDL